MAHGPDRDIHGRTAHHTCVRRERAVRTISQVTDGAAVVPDPPSTSDTPASAGPIPSPASARHTPSPASAGPIRSPASAKPTSSTSTTPSRRPQDDPKGTFTSELPPPSRRVRRGSTSSAGPPLEVHEDDREGAGTTVDASMEGEFFFSKYEVLPEIHLRKLGAKMKISVVCKKSMELVEKFS
ncbi:early nodulin-like protein 18 [Vicia villosa]|uniref:early nodulin-like protein 18 n=1 Tax=Vicia villosa TaxID=3911 RepID=UPI00273CE84D|nr:early nodulin-like protein 18 [Vicia villosa]